jgi:hypothetical protein
MADEKFVVLAELNRILKKKPVLVGGGAAEVYSAGHFVTGDLDIYAERSELIPALENLGFRREGMYFVRGKIFIHVVGSNYEKRVDDILVKGTGHRIRVISLEDLIVDRLNSCKWWKHEADCEQARYLLNTFREGLDTSYLEQRVDEENVRDILDSLRAAPTHLKGTTRKEER